MAADQGVKRMTPIPIYVWFITDDSRSRESAGETCGRLILGSMASASGSSFSLGNSEGKSINEGMSRIAVVIVNVDFS